jgi:hypothetical protein
MRLRIVRPLPSRLEDFDVSHLKFGAIHDITHPLCDLLLASGYGIPVGDTPMSPIIKEQPLRTAQKTKPAKASRPTRRSRHQGNRITTNAFA